jgi:glycosyltransferase involved in cell wall biosynthesis
VSATAEQCQHLRPYDYRGPLVDIKQTNMIDRQRMEDSRPLEAELADWCAQASFVVTFVGNLSSFKGPLGFVRAMPGILEKHGNTRFLVVGDGPLRAEVESEVERLELHDSVRLTGARDDIGSLLRTSTVFVANSPVSNCYSATVIEAMEIGVPCVVSDAGDPSGSYTAKDYVESVRPKDPADLARGVVRLLDDPELRRRRIQMGRSFIVDFGFTPDAVIERSMETYQALLERRHLDLANWPPHLMNYTD